MKSSVRKYSERYKRLHQVSLPIAKWASSEIQNETVRSLVNYAKDTNKNTILWSALTKYLGLICGLKEEGEWDVSLELHWMLGD